MSSSQMIQSRPNSAGAVLIVLVIMQFLFFLIAGLLHLGISIPAVFVTLSEPRIVPAFIVEEAIAAGYAVATLALLTRSRWAWQAAFAAHLFAFIGVVIGMASLTLGSGRYPRTKSNDLYHYAMLVLILIGLLLLESPAVRSRLKSPGSGNDASKAAVPKAGRARSHQ